MSIDIDSIRSALAEYQPRRMPEERRKIFAAVAVILRQAPEGVEVLLIHRARNPRDPWSGDMAFPGGRVEASDDGPEAAAVREAHEEVDLDLSQDGRPLGRLSDGTPRGRGRELGIVIEPFAYVLEGEPELRPNDEVQEIVWVPLSFFADRSNRSTMWWWRRWPPKRLPCFRYRDHLIWGLTLRVLDELVELAIRLK
jgi:8-oxo-dGTP pyrophosphatase MutT (NUDIX family)